MLKQLDLDFEIVTERLRLRIPVESDIPHVFSASRYPGFTDGMLWSPPESIDELRGPYERSREQWESGQAYQFSIDAGEALVGRIALRPSDRESVLDIGYWTHPEHYGKGYMTEAVRAIVDLAFYTMGATSVEAGTADWNKASQRVLEKVGFVLDEVIPNGFVKGDRVCDDLIFRLKRFN